MKKVTVLGAGMVGSVMAADLAAVEPRFEVTVADAREDSLKRVAERCSAAGVKVTTVCADLSSAAEVRRLIANADIVVGALASRIAFAALRTIIEAGKNFCDISFMAEDPLELDGLAKKHGVTCVVDCGVAPGMSHMLAGYAAANLSPCEEIEIYVGGLPRERRWPFEYKAAFSPADVIEEYTRPTRLVEHGQVVVREALSEPELMNFDGAGTLEAFNTDGLRSLVQTLGRGGALAKQLGMGEGGVPFMKEKTLRYAGHIELMRVFRETGLFGEELVEVGAGANAVKVRPRELVSKLMFPKWTYGPGEEDLTVMRVTGVGKSKTTGKRVRLSWDLFDLFDKSAPGGGATSMARTTAFPCTSMARMVASGKYRAKSGGGGGGVVVPEFIGAEAGMLEAVLGEHERRGVRYVARSEDGEGAADQRR